VIYVRLRLREKDTERNRIVLNLPDRLSTLRYMTERLTITIPEAAKLLGISRGAAYAAAADKTIPTIRIGRRLLVPRAAFDRMLAINPTGTRKATHER
jgi:excisionase family DNA binding protein